MSHRNHCTIPLIEVAIATGGMTGGVAPPLVSPQHKCAVVRQKICGPRHHTCDVRGHRTQRNQKECGGQAPLPSAAAHDHMQVREDRGEQGEG